MAHSETALECCFSKFTKLGSLGLQDVKLLTQVGKATMLGNREHRCQPSCHRPPLHRNPGSESLHNVFLSF